ncbi:MAG: IS66 family transposase [Nitrospirales bacterium]|nr:IS66 family transposase [Nitrospirales bacterium]
MARHPWAPHDFVCQYEHTCPYLGGLSTKWVFGQYRRSGDVYQEHLRIIDNFSKALRASEERVRVLERENAELQAKYQALHRKQFKANRRKRDEPAIDNCPAKATGAAKKKKRGAPVGHQGWSRPEPTRIDRIVSVPAPSVCPRCGSKDVTPEQTLREHLQEDIVIKPQTIVTKYIHEEAFCHRCKREVVGTGSDEIPHAPIGPIAKSTAAYLRYEIGISYRKVQHILDDLFGLSCVAASLVGFDRRAAKRGEPLYDDIREKIRASDVVHADETSWRNDGVGHYVWFAGNEDLAFFHIDRHRSAEAARTVFGEDFNGSLVRDRYAAYNNIGTDWQACLAHIITNAKDISREHALLPEGEQDRAVIVFCDHLINLCSRACDAGQKLKSGELPWEEAATIEARFIREVGNICKKPLRFKPAETLRKFLIGPQQKHLTTFLRIPGVAPTNNHAEQSLRKMVIFRKVCFGTRSDIGLKTHSIIPTLVQTARRQGVHPRDFLHILHTEDSASAQAALFNNSS